SWRLGLFLRSAAAAAAAAAARARRHRPTRRPPPLLSSPVCPVLSCPVLSCPVLSVLSWPSPVRRLCPSALAACPAPLLARSSLPVLRPLSAALPGSTVCLRVSPSAFLSLSPPTQRGAPRTAGSAALRLRRSPAPRSPSPGQSSPGCRTAAAGPGAIALPARTPPSPAHGPEMPGRAGVCLCVRCLCLSVRPPVCPWLPARRPL
ncbi:hypothetical protein HGM15179_000512, partial [Zosterops borbonicus]